MLEVPSSQCHMCYAKEEATSSEATCSGKWQGLIGLCFLKSSLPLSACDDPPSDRNCSMMFSAPDSLMSQASLSGALQSITSPLGRFGSCTSWSSATSARVFGTSGALSATGRLCGVGSGLGSAGSLSNTLQHHSILRTHPWARSGVSWDIYVANWPARCKLHGKAT